MPWTDKPGGGANGSGGGNGGKGPIKGPWGQPQNGDKRPSRPSPQRPGQRPGQAPDLEELLRSGRERFKRGAGGGGGRGGRGGEPVQLPSGRLLGLGAAALGLLWIASGVYQVGAGERGVVTTFGDFTTLTSSGLNWHVPWPVQDVVKVDVQEDRQISVSQGTGGRSTMLTSDLNIVDVEMTVSYRIKDDADTAEGELPNAAKYVFNIGVDETQKLVRAAANAALREVIGGQEFRPIIAGQRALVNERTAAILQDTLDRYDSGIDILRVNFQRADPPEAVIGSQRDVVDARSEAEEKINNATGYANRRVPVARGEARQKVLQAEAYAAQVVAEARGDAARFEDIYAEYAKAPEVTRRRMYLETMEKVLGDIDKVVIDDQSGGTLPYLNVNELARGSSRNAAGGN